MSSKPKGNLGTGPQTTSAQAETGKASVGNSTRDEEIRRRAYEIYLERGEQPDRELDDWPNANSKVGFHRRRRARKRIRDIRG